MITNIRLQNFRSYKDSSFEFSDGVNIVVGPNATGKTNLIEAIHLVARNSSFRVKDIDLVAFGNDWSRIDSYISGNDRIVKIEKSIDKASKTTIINGKEYKRLPKNQYYPVVLFEPNQLNILSGSPEARRNLIDELLSQVDVGHSTNINNYKRILLQRNSLLKSGYRDSSQMFVWNTRLVEKAWEIVQRRLSMIEEMNKSISDIYSDVAGKKYNVSLEYQSSCDVNNYVNSLFKKLESSIDKDYARGFTGSGPHRDDVRGVYRQNRY
jgi:DNA replication and repair protein RecF